MKKVFILSLLWFAFTTNLQAQSETVEKVLPVPANKKVDLKLTFGNDIKITAWDKDEASIKVTYEINNGKLNDALLLNFKADNESARAEVDLDKELLKNGKAEDCPENKSNIMQVNGEYSVTCTNINYEIFVPRDADLTVETINGDIELRGLTGPVQAKSISGFVDMNWSERKGATVSLETITGEVYSDLGIDFTNGRENAPMVGYELKGNVNGGGSLISLESISNDIYLRKQD
ncbi:hypothetical protein DXT99_25565 [Pontibacter diazotrophicus]|uniref:Adhesin domain-containing protein n=1 Tax=Pontibacter diazotrophicus TaxID=1400979 RepID=A0A3D8L0Y0_9BACT|nr:hypothetical protein [Pontibacter diazotrophicus]RDV11041.1 hypothetical protein DXT99_25565 [Pontibacter diazotrophicus]